VRKLGKTSTTSKDAWNRNRYTQVKFYVLKDLASGFKSTCTTRAVSMASVLSKHMADFCSLSLPIKQSNDLSTLPKRRRRIQMLIHELELVLDAEQTYQENIPESFSSRIEASEERISSLEEAISQLSEYETA
jgi:hypothetical protein